MNPRPAAICVKLPTRVSVGSIAFALTHDTRGIDPIAGIEPVKPYSANVIAPILEVKFSLRISNAELITEIRGVDFNTIDRDDVT